jgi:hypothetical protein
MEVLPEQPPEAERQHGPGYERLVVGAIAPHPLMWAARAVQAGGRAGRAPAPEFPLLDRVQESSPEYVDEDLWLPPADVLQLLHEFRRLRRLCHWQEFVPGFDGARAAMAWRRDQPAADFERLSDRIEELLGVAVAGASWVRLML